jgi:hypothetical protein
MRNPDSPQRDRFMALRQAAIDAMAGRKWYEGAIRLDFLYFAPEHGSLIGSHDYLGGILDTLDGSHGPSFIYLPVVYLDDCQVVEISLRREVAPAEGYEIAIEFLGDNSSPSDP